MDLKFGECEAIALIMTLQCKHKSTTQVHLSCQKTQS